MSTVDSLIWQLKQGLISKEEFVDSVGRATEPLAPAVQTPNLYTPDRRIEQYLIAKEERRVKADERKQSELSQCTFHPQTNNHSPLSADPFARLYQAHVANCESFQQLLDWKRAQAEFEECTFAPCLNEYRPLPRSQFNRHKYSAVPQPRFNPTIRGATRNMPAAQQYLHKNAFERLHTQKALKKTYASEANFSPEEEYAQLPSSISGCMSDSLSSLSFLERQSRHEQVKQQKLQLQRTLTPTRSPSINRRSQQLVNKDFFDRNKQFLQTKALRREQTEQDLSRECTFKPVITPKGKRARGRYLQGTGQLAD